MTRPALRFTTDQEPWAALVPLRFGGTEWEDTPIIQAWQAKRMLEFESRFV